MCDSCGYKSPLFIPLTSIFVGFVILMFNMGVLPENSDKFWPVIPVIIGLIGLSNMGCTDCMTPTKTKKKSKR